MDGNKLDFNAPLISVRVKRKTKEAPRPVRNLSLPSQKSDWEMTEVAKPAAVPFVWEQIPGRPKNGNTNQSLSPPEPSVSPMFPPGRTFDNKKRVSGEQFQDKNVCRPHVEASPVNEDVKCLDLYKKSAGSLSDDEAYCDALDTLLESESNSWNCSVSGLSGYDGPYAGSSSSFSADPQTREIMMTRFLPAARAMAVKKESKKQPMASELPKHVKKVLSGELRPMLEKYGSNTAIHQSRYKGSVPSEDEDDVFIDHGRKSIKVCGLLPRLCVKNSLSLLDPMPVIKSRAQSPIPSVPDRRMARTAHSGPLPQTHHEKQDWNDVYWKNMQKNIQSRVQKQEPVNNKLNGVSKQLNHSTDLYKTKSRAPHRLSRSGGISPFRNEKPQSPFYDGAKFLGIPRIVKDNEANKFGPIDRESDKRDDSVHQTNKQGLGSFIALAEKTVHIDPLYNAEVPKLDLVSSKVEIIDKVSNKTTLGESRKVEGFSSPKPFTRKKIVKPIAVVSLSADKPSYPDISNLEIQATSNRGVKHEQNIDQEPRSTQCLVCSPKDNLDKNEDTEKVNNQGKSNIGILESPKPPPLPKSPSESWLWRTVPSVSLRNPFSEAQTRKQHTKTSKSAAKWETIVRLKASHVHHEHLRHSEELISHVSQHLKT